MMQKECKLHMIGSDEKMMVNGRFQYNSPHSPHTPIQIERGMKIVVADGTEAGVVGAVLVHPQNEDVTHILLCRLPVTAVYRLIPISLIAKVSEKIIHLKIQCHALKKLAVHQPS